MPAPKFAWYRYVAHPHWEPVLLEYPAVNSDGMLYRTSDPFEVQLQEWPAEACITARKQAVVSLLNREQEKHEALQESA
jgi:hypothetical protein